MAIELIPIGTTSATSADITVNDSPVTVFLKDADGAGMAHDPSVLIEIKDSAGQYTTIGRLRSTNPAVVISGPGTYRLHRIESQWPVGAERS